MAIINDLFHRLMAADTVVGGDGTSLDHLRQSTSLSSLSSGSLSDLFSREFTGVSGSYVGLLRQILDPPDVIEPPPRFTLSYVMQQSTDPGLGGSYYHMLSAILGPPAEGGGDGIPGGGLDHGGGGVPALPPAPVILGLPTAVSYMENSLNVIADTLGGAVTIVDANSSRFQSVRVTYKVGGGAEDKLSVRNQGVGAGQIGFAGGVVTYGGVTIGTVSSTLDGVSGAALLIILNSDATKAATAALIENLTYQNTSNDPATERTITITLDDGDGNTLNPVDIDIGVTPEVDNVLTPALDNLLGTGIADTVSGDADDLQAGDTIDGGGGADEIDLLTPGSATVGANVSNIPLIVVSDTGSYSITVTTPAMAGFTIDGSALTSTNALSVDASAYAGNLTIIGGAGADAVTLGSGNYDITFNGGNDSVTSANANFDASNTIAGGTGTDAILFSNAAAIDGTELANLTGIDILQFSANANTVVLTDAFVDASDADSVELANSTFTVTSLNTSAVNSARDVVIGGTGAVTLTDGVNNRVVGKTGVNNSIAGGTGIDTLSFTNAAFTSADSLAGGGANDIIQFTTAASQVDTAFANKTTMERITLGNFTGQSLTLAANAEAAGIRTVDGSAATGTNTLSVNGSAYAAINLSLIGGAGNDTLIGGAATDSFDGGAGNDSLVGNNGGDRFRFLNANYDANDTIQGGNNADELWILDTATLVDAQFANTVSIFHIILANFTGQSVTIGAVAQTKGIRSVDATALTGANTVSVDASAYTTGLVFTGGAGADSVLSGSGNDSLTGNAGNDVFVLTSANFDASDTVAGGANSDTIQFTTAASVVDAAFANKTTVERILFSDFNAQSLTIAANAVTAGIVSIDGSALTGTNTASVDASAYTVAISITGGAGNDTIRSNSGNDTIAAGGGDDSVFSASGNDSLDGGAGNDTFTFTNANFDSSDTIAGSTGTDALSFTDAALISSADLTNKTSIEVFTLSANANTFVFTDAFVDSSDTDTVELANGAFTVTSLDTSAVNSARNVVVGGTGLVTLANVANRVLSKDGVNTSILGGSNNDTIIGGTGADTLDGSTGADSIIGGDGNDNLISGGGTDTVSGGNGNDTIDGGTGTKSIDAGADDDTVLFASVEFTAADTVNGNTGTDTLSFTTATTLLTGNFANITSFEIIAFSANGNSIALSDAFVDSATSDSVELANGAFTITSLNTNAVNSARSVVIGGTGAVTLAAGSNHRVYSKAGVNTSIVSTTSSDTITGNSGNDTFVAGSGNDSFDGGTGNDTFTFADTDFTNGDTIAGNTGTDVFSFTDAATIASADLTNKTSIEVFTLSANANTFVFTDAFVDSSDTDTVEIANGAFTVTSLNTNAVNSARTVIVGGTGAVTLANSASRVQAKDGVNTSIIGGTAADTIIGGTGNDTIGASGTTGLDSVQGGTGNDQIIGSGGADTLSFAGGFSLAANSIETIDGGAGTNIIAGSTGLSYDFTGVTLTNITEIRAPNNGASSATYTIIGSGGNDTFTVYIDGNDAATIDGGGGNDTIIYDSTAAGSISITGGTGTDTLSGTAASETIRIKNGFSLATSSIEAIDGGAGTNYLSVLTGSTYDFTGVTITNIAQIQVPVSGASASYTVIGSGGNDTIAVYIDSNDSASVDGGSGDDTLVYDSTATGYATLQGGTGNDTLSGTAASDTIRIAAGFSLAATSIEAIDGGAGTNYLSVLTGSTYDFTGVTITNIAQIQVPVSGAFGSYTVIGSGGNDTIAVYIDSNDSASVDGGSGDDTLVYDSTATGYATLQGGTGNDTLSGTAASDTIRIAAGFSLAATSIETIDGGAGTNTLTLKHSSSYDFTGVAISNISAIQVVNSGASTITTIIGTASDDVIQNNGSGTDRITANGGAGNDTIISGSSGTDTIAGGDGVDSMTGGTGGDVFVYTATTNSGTGAGSRDIITDFVTASDDIDLSAFAGAATFRAGGNGAADFTAGFQVAWEQTGGNTIVYVDTDGNNATDFEIQLTGLIALVAGDFVL